MELIQTGVEILTITERGYGKRSEAEEYRVQSRGGKGILAMKLTEKTGNIVQIKQVNDKEDLVIITDKGQVIRTKIAGISLLGRNTQGVRLINVKPDEKVVAVEKMAESEEETEDGNQSPVES
jgi:DNA gyrase subunit A